MKAIFFILLGAFLILKLNLNAQNRIYKCYYEVGKPAPEYLFDHILNFKTTQAKISDFRGKWLILDFWNYGCSACIGSFPEHNAEQIRYKDNVQFLLVGTLDKDNKIEPLFNKLKKNLKLQLPCALDSVIDRKYNVETSGDPFIVVIDPDGIVRGSGGDFFNIGVDLDQLTSTNRPILHDYYREHFKMFSYDSKKMFLVNNNGGPDSSCLFRSVLTIWNPTLPSLSKIDTTKIFIGEIVGIGTNVPELYQLAYTGFEAHEPSLLDDDPQYGVFWTEPLFHFSDISNLKNLVSKSRAKIVFPGNYIQFRNPERSYSYALNVPKEKANKEFMMKIMKQDLNNYFNLNAHIESKLMPCWKLIATEKAKKDLKTKGQLKNARGEDNWVQNYLKDIPISKLLARIEWYLGDLSESAPLFDETGIVGNIDINLEWSKHDFNAILMALRKNGLDLIKGERETKVLILSDIH